MAVSRFEVYLVALDPTVGHEIKKTRPAVVVSPDEMNHHVRTAIVVPMTTSMRAYRARVNCQFKGKPGQIAVDRLRCVDQRRLIKRLGKLDPRTSANVLAILAEMFAP